ncbi:hypothetical protein G4X40_06490 [Rhodococcus sp. D2-41]|uniref:SMI1/KNR4 family protein n=1 Tax=Speluncibacter jeojiensis TaxID=2710754 RepID=A0A9X4LY76_9ACTN|nr:hypothetical protein [Rhodococcus sp. D2-41]MDG3009793.1 hypothetical protein [Rhodococcus sp. D2-41]MDG3014544.1 SMI1/KNR4 family protein [Corynebacteriales bacterium D3-21]
MSAALDRLRELVEPPEGVVGYDWSATEKELGLRLPEDFTQLVDTYGCVLFGDTFRPYHPDPQHPWVDLATCTSEMRENLDVPIEYPPESIPAGVTIDDPSAFVSWGGSDSGDYFLWHTGSPNPDEWTIVLTDLYPAQWYFYSGSVSELLVDWLTHRIRPPQLPKYFDRDERLGGTANRAEFFDPAAPDGEVVRTVYIDA